MADIDADRVNELADEVRDHPGVVLYLDAATCMALIGQLQLALRHPENRAGSRLIAREIVDRIGAEFGPAVRRLIEEGWT